MSHTLVQDMTYLSVTDFEENRFWFWRKSFSDFEENRFLIWENHFLILEKIVFWFWRKSFSDFEENRFLIFSRFYNTIYEAHLHTKKIVCKSRDFNTIFGTIYSTIFLVWVVLVHVGSSEKLPFDSPPPRYRETESHFRALRNCSIFKSNFYQLECFDQIGVSSIWKWCVLINQMLRFD